MGNVGATSKPIGSAGGGVTTTPPLDFSSLEPQISEKKPLIMLDNLENPGTVEELHKKCKG